MMNKLYERINEWINERGSRERQFIFALGFLMIYLFCFLIIIKPVSKHKKDLVSNIVTLQLQKDSTQKQIENFNLSMKDPAFVKQLNQQKVLVGKINTLENKLKTMKPLLTSLSELPTLTKTILTHPAYNVTLINLKEIGERPWIPDMKSITNMPIETTGILEHGYVMEFKSDYFSTIQYLNWIEKLPYHIYWDSLQYKVGQYPVADVLMTIRVLTKE